MTNNKPTEEQIRTRIEALKNCAGGSLRSTYAMDALFFEELLAARAELQEYRKAAGEPALYCMAVGGDLDTESVSTCKSVVDSWVEEWNERIPVGGTQYETVALYTTPQPAPSVEAVPVVPNEAIVGEMPFLGTKESAYVSGWNACRAAMQQPVSNRDELPDGLLKAAAFYRQVERDNPPVETGAWKDAVDWIIREALAAAPQQKVK